jgi:hypothetical protein
MKRAGATKSLFLISDRSNPIHASVGVIIAIVANTWAGRIVPPFIWGFIWCARLALLPSDLPRGRRHKLTTFYAAQYVRAVIGSLVLALAIGSLKVLFRYLVLGYNRADVDSLKAIYDVNVKVL